ncbi:helix-turn-helix domain-containing protein [Tardiphaga sp. 538_B7_N1_4]|uniref:helix-turn-helix domain-containing protein n=1 Tax=Tardiphaga sp. 538_B7_N1_4 TaxID=3240778 RepID=UPI003F1EE3BD
MSIKDDDHDTKIVSSRTRKASDGLLAALIEHHDFNMQVPDWWKIAPTKAEIAALKQAEQDIRRGLEVIKQKRLTEIMGDVAEITELPCPTMQEIIRGVCVHFKLPKLALLSSRRDKHVVHPRMVACYIARYSTKLSLPSIGRHMGNRDHTTILHSVNKMERLISEGHPIVADIEDIRTHITIQIETRVRLENEINADLRNRFALEAPLIAAPDRASTGAGSTGKAAQRPPQRAAIAP